MTTDEPEDAESFAKKFGVTFPIYRDVSLSLVKAFGAFANPFNAVLSHEGKVLYAEAGGDVATIRGHALAAIEAAKLAAAETEKARAAKEKAAKEKSE